MFHVLCVTQREHDHGAQRPRALTPTLELAGNAANIK